MTRTTRFLLRSPTMLVRESLEEATEHRQGCITPVKHVQKKEPRRGDRIQAGVKPLTNMRKKKKPQRGDGTAAHLLSFRHSSGVLMGDAFFHTGVALPLTPACSPSLLRSFLGQPLQEKTSERRQTTGRGAIENRRRGTEREAVRQPLLSMRKKKKPRRGDGPQAGVKPLLSMRKKKKPQRGDGTAAHLLSFRHSSGVFIGGRFYTGVALSLTPACSPSFLRSFLGQPLQGETSER